MNNRKRLTLASFLAYFVMSGMLAPMGIVSGPMAEHFALPVTVITARFSWLTVGILCGAGAALFVFDWLGLRQIMLSVYTLIAAALVSLLFAGNPDLIGLALGLVGLCCGIGLAAAALVISRSYAAERRASMLVITDGSFSVAGVVTSWIAVFLLSQHLHWSGVYQFVALVALGIVLLSMTATFPDASHDRAPGEPNEPWPAAAWLCIASLFLYTLGQWSVLLWLPTYAEASLGAPPDRAGQLVGQFWTGMFAAQVFVAWWVLKVGVRRLVLVAGISTSLFSIPLWIVGDLDTLLVLSTLWGFANLGLLKVVLSFATQTMQNPSPRLVSSLLLGATLGTAVSPSVTSAIVTATSTHFALQFGTVCYVALTLLLLASAGMVRAAERSIEVKNSA